MKHICLIIAAIALISLFGCKNAETQDWAKIEADYRAQRMELEEAGYPEAYILKNGKNYSVFDGTPELGVGMHEIDQKAIDTAKKMNIRFIRHTLYWGMLESEKGVYNKEYLADFHRKTDLCEKNGMVLLVVVHQAPAGLTFANKEEAYERFADFMAWAAKEFPTVRYWQLWNEMDTAFTDLFGAGVKKEDGTEYSLTERGTFYTDMLKLAYPSIKKANPKAVVVCGPGAVPGGEFQEGIYKAGGKDYFDIMSIHTYGTPVMWQFVGRGKEVRDIMNRYKDDTKPLWNTEFGVEAGSLYSAWGVPENPLKTWLEQQRDHLSDCIEFNMRAGLYQKYFIYQYMAGLEGNKEAILEKVEVPEGDTIDNYGFGIVNQDHSLKPIGEWIRDNNPNKKVKSTHKANIKIGKSKKSVTLNSAYPVTVK